MGERLRTFMRLVEGRVWAAAGLLALAALAVRIPLITAEHRVTPGGDSESYMRMAEAMARGDGFGDGGYRTPGYPLFILLVDFVFPGGRVDDAVVAQHLLAVAFVAAVVILATRLFDLATAIVAGGVFALTPALPYLEHAVLSDFLFGLVVFAFAIVLGRMVEGEQPSIRLLAAAGALAALATYVRPSGQALALAVVLAAAVGLRGIRPRVRAVAVVGATFALLVSPWIVRNAVQFDRAAMSTVTGDTLFVRAFEVDRMDIPTDRPTGVLAAGVAGSGTTVRLVTAVTLAYQAYGMDRRQALAAQQSLAQTAIWRNPFTYAVGTVEEIGRLRVDPRDANLGSDVGPHLPSPPAATEDVWEATGWLSGVWWALSLGTFAGLLVLVAPRRQTRAVGIGLLATWLALALGTALSRGALTRYALEFAPIAVVLGSYGAVTVVRSVVAVVGRSRTRQREPAARAQPREA